MLMMVAVARGVYVCVEQPRSSVMPWFDPMARLAERIAAWTPWFQQSLPPDRKAILVLSTKLDGYVGFFNG